MIRQCGSGMSIVAIASRRCADMGVWYGVLLLALMVMCLPVVVKIEPSDCGRFVAGSNSTRYAVTVTRYGALPSALTATRLPAAVMIAPTSSGMPGPVIVSEPCRATRTGYALSPSVLI